MTAPRLPDKATVLSGANRAILDDLRLFRHRDRGGERGQVVPAAALHPAALCGEELLAGSRDNRPSVRTLGRCVVSSGPKTDRRHLRGIWPLGPAGGWITLVHVLNHAAELPRGPCVKSAPVTQSSIINSLRY